MVEVIETAEGLISDSIDLIALPDIFIQVNSMLDDPRFVAADVAEVISKDPALTARILKIANSPLYGLNGRIDTLTRAMTFIGVNEIRDMLLSTSVVDTFGKIPQDLVDINDFWIRSVQCGVLARLLAKKCSVLHSERLFMIGLLHDLGSMVMYCKLPEVVREILTEAGNNRKTISELEVERLGFSSPEVGRALLASWSLPVAMQDSIGFQGFPEDAPAQYRLDCHLLSVARELCRVTIDGMTLEQVVGEDLPARRIEFLNLKKEDIVEVLEIMPEMFADIFSIIVPSNRILY